MQNPRVLSNAQRTKMKKRLPVWYIASWNVCSLLDIEGSIESARQGKETDQAEDRRIDQVIRELNRYQVSVGALQETKWFGDAIYHVGESIVLAAGRPTPSVGQTRQRGEGVAIVLNGPAITAWKAGGEQWKAWSSRMITATLVRGRRSSDRLHVISCYAPTFAASRAEKDNFFDDLQQALNKIVQALCDIRRLQCPCGIQRWR